MTKKVAVIGGGPAGIIAAATAAYNGNSVTLFEKNEKLGKKLFLTGKGRCNLTNTADFDELFSAVCHNSKFLYSALYSFTCNDIIDIVEKNGTKTKVERGGRVFPESDKSSDVIRALSRYLDKSGAKLLLNTLICSIDKNSSDFSVSYETNGNQSSDSFDAVIIATGGKSYSSTGSTGDGYYFAEKLGHKLIPPLPSLVPLITKETWVKEVQGLSLKNVTLSAFRSKKRIYSELGEMLFTHFGVSGPLVLSLSAKIADSPNDVLLQIDLKPGLDLEQLDRRILSDFVKNNGKQFKNSLSGLLPSSLISVIINECGISPDKPVAEITKQERSSLVNTLKALSLTVTGTGCLDEAIITRGGIAVSDINPSTMESKKVPGLYFAGEVIDCDAKTGGFNLQIAYSTGFLAGSLE